MDSWLIAFILYSVSSIIVYFDQTLWDKLLNLAEEKYGVAKPVLPTRLHVNSKNLKEDLLHFVETHTRFVIEVPAFQGEMVFNLPDTFLSPYCTAPASQESKLNLSSLTHNLRIKAEETKLIFHRIHKVLRIQAIDLPWS